jgi:hypothetical protein
VEGFHSTNVDYSADYAADFNGPARLVQDQHKSPRTLWIGVVASSFDEAANNVRDATLHEMMAFYAQHPDLVANRNRVCAYGTAFPDRKDTSNISITWLYPEISTGPEYFGQKEGANTRYGLGDYSCNWTVMVER